MLTSLFLSFSLAAQAYATEVTMGSNGNLVFEPNDITINAGDTAVSYTHLTLPTILRV